MKVAELLIEMAKSSTKRKREAKRARKSKAKKPTMDAPSNPVAKFAQQSGAGAHKEEGKYAKSKAQRKEAKQQIKQELE
jgi:hypothetical protein